MKLTAPPPARALLADDDDAVRRMLATLLKLHGLDVCEARDGPEALALLATEMADVVLLDLCMPGMNGLEVLRQAFKLDPTLSIILISGQASISTAVEAVKSGAYDFISKPFANDELLLKIHHAVEIHRLKKENQQLRSQIDEARRHAEAKSGAPAPCTVPDCPQSIAGWRIDGSTSLWDMVQASVARTERAILARALRQTGGNKARAARLLQIDYKTLRSRVKEYGLSEGDDGPVPRKIDTHVGSFPG